MRRHALSVPLLAGLVLVAHAATAAPPSSAQTAPTVVLEAGTTPDTRPFPDDRFTVADAAQATGKRVALPTAGCEADGTCADLAVINTLDGFDVRPRVQLPFSGPVDLRSITASTVRVEGPGGFSTGLTQLVQDPLTGDVSGFPVDYLRPGTAHTLVVDSGVRAADGSAVGGLGRRTTFTTLTTTSVLDKARTALDDGSAYAAASIPADQRTLRFDTAANGARSVFPASTTTTRIERIDQVRTATGATPTVSTVTNTARTFAFYGFGSITSPQYLDPTVRIPQVPTTQAPAVRGAARLGVAMLAPRPTAGTCLRPVVFGHGFTRSKYDVFLAADTLGESNLAIFATDVVGHGFGPQSQYRVTVGAGTATGTVTTGTSLGRGRDLTGDGVIDSTEGVATAGVVNSRDGLIQTVVDQMALVRALQRGVDVDGDGTVDTCTAPGSVAYYGQSFGGIYGTMLLGTDPSVPVGVPNVAGGPIPEITRLGAFRPLAALGFPTLLNAGPGLNGFTESLPLRRDPRISDPVQGAVPVAASIARSTWATRSGSPEAYAARLGSGGTFAAKDVIFQVAYGDGTVPNPMSAEILRAGGLYEKAWVYRNDRTGNAGNNPHFFLLEPFLPAHFEAQEQIRRFIATNGDDERDPDTPQRPGWEPVVAKAGSTPTTDYRVQLDCLHYPDPQTGSPQTRTAPLPDCTDRSAEVAPARAEDALRVVTLPTAQRALDTRTQTGRVTGRVTLDLRAFVPDAAASAAVLNVTVLGASKRGFVTAFSSGSPLPGTSNVNVDPTVPTPQANQAVVRLSQDRKVDLFVETTAHVVVDVVGYLTTRSPAGAAPLQALDGERLLDTRTTATRQRTGEVVVQLPATAASATAVVLNVTATAARGRGLVVAYPTGGPRPGTSNVNFGAGQTRSNEVLVPVGDGGRVTLAVDGGPAALVVDLVGVVRGTTGGTVSLDRPLRAADTRSGTGLRRGVVRGPVSLVLPAGVPATATSVLLNVTAVNGTAPGFVTVYPTGAAMPATSNLTFPARLPQANEVLSRVGTGRAVTLDVGGSRGAATHLVVDVVGYTTG